MGTLATPVSAHPVLFQPPHHAGGSVEPKGRPAGQHHRVCLLHQVHGVKRIDSACAGRVVVLIYAHRPFTT